MTTRIVLELSDKELAIVDRWKRDYLTLGQSVSREGAIHDLLKRIADDMTEMDEVSRWVASDSTE